MPSYHLAASVYSYLNTKNKNVCMNAHSFLFYFTSILHLCPNFYIDHTYEKKYSNYNGRLF